MAGLLKRVWATPKPDREEGDADLVVIVRDYTGGRAGRQPHECLPPAWDDLPEAPGEPTPRVWTDRQWPRLLLRMSILTSESQH
jgi:hypothetical protein